MNRSQALFISPAVADPERFVARLGRGLGKASAKYLGQLPVPPAQAGPALRVLTPRQREILRELALGKGVKEISRLLGISAKTVETHRSQLRARLGIHRLPSLVRFAIQTGLLPVTWLLERE
jgi:DNA-binding NarL/FixJ family response regulator